jgi:hypothetical protein
VGVYIFVVRAETPSPGVIVTDNITGDYLVVTYKERADVVGDGGLAGVGKLKAAEPGHPGGYHYLHLYDGAGWEGYVSFSGCRSKHTRRNCHFLDYLPIRRYHLRSLT